MESILVLYPLAGHLGTCHAVWVAVKCSRLALAALLWFAPAHAQQVPDTLEQRLVACAACHGKNGEGLKANEYYPRIAGKPARYLFNQLVNFRERRRQSPAMNYMVGFLSDDYLRDIARYYAMQPPRYPVARGKPWRGGPAPGGALMPAGGPGKKAPRLRRLPRRAPHRDGAGDSGPGRPGGALHRRADGRMAPPPPARPGARVHGEHRLAADPGRRRAHRRVPRKPPAPRARRAAARRLAEAPHGVRRRMNQTQRLTAVAILGVAIVLGIGFVVHFPWKSDPPRGGPAGADLKLGEYLIQAGNCYSCHTAHDGKPYAGGRPVATPYGTLYSSNITPDPQTGVGNWSADDFWRALHEGKPKDGSLLYPAFPYWAFTKVTREHADAMYAYLKSIPPVSQQNRAHEMRFPYDRRPLLARWQALYFREGEFKPDPRQTPEWNRGAYLVEGLGHCAACHGQRGAWGSVREKDIGGGLIPMLNWYAQIG